MKAAGATCCPLSFSAAHSGRRLAAVLVAVLCLLGDGRRAGDRQGVVMGCGGGGMVPDGLSDRRLLLLSAVVWYGEDEDDLGVGLRQWRWRLA
ncbi:hypothetical protein Dimus_015704 [Dionaea muscipula]